MKKSEFIDWLSERCPPEEECSHGPGVTRREDCKKHWAEFLAALEPDDEEPTEANLKERATMSEIKPDRYAGSWTCSADSCSQWDDKTPEGGLTPCKMLQEMDYTPCQEALLRENVTLKARVRELEGERVAKLHQQEFDQLPKREWGLPTGKRVGRMWKSPTSDGGWVLSMYVPSAKEGMIDILKAKIEIYPTPESEADND